MEKIIRLSAHFAVINYGTVCDYSISNFNRLMELFGTKNKTDDQLHEYDVLKVTTYPNRAFINRVSLFDNKPINLSELSKETIIAGDDFDKINDAITEIKSQVAMTVRQLSEILDEHLVF